MLEEIDFEWKVEDDKSFKYTVMFKEPVTLNTGDILVMICADGMPISVTIRRKK